MFHYMAIDPLTGFNILNKFLRPLRIPVNVESDYLRPFMKIILGRQLNMLFRSLQKKDAVIAFEDLNRFKEEELITLCFKRGINVEQKTNDMLGDLKLWFSISNLRDVPPSLLLFAMMREFVQNTFEVDEFDTQEDILRRVSNFLFNNHNNEFVYSPSQIPFNQKKCAFLRKLLVLTAQKSLLRPYSLILK